MTPEIIDVAHIAQKLGFKVSGVEVIRAQTLRVLSMSAEYQQEQAEAVAYGGRNSIA